MEFSPAGMYCENRCVYCWRPMEFYDSMKMEPEKVAEPEQIVSKLMEERRKLIMGHYGDARHEKKKLDESLFLHIMQFHFLENQQCIQSYQI